MTSSINFIRLHKDALLPKRATPQSACFDLHALIPGDGSIRLSAINSRQTFATGVGLELPAGYAGLICSRSGLATKHGISVVNSPGIIDSDYRGELKVILAIQPRDLIWPETEADYLVKNGDRIAQLLILKEPTFNDPTDFLPTFTTDTDRGNGGFGSTGI